MGQPLSSLKRTGRQGVGHILTRVGSGRGVRLESITRKKPRHILAKPEARQRLVHRRLEADGIHPLQS